MKNIEEYIRSIPDFPKEGIIFRDVTTVLQDADGFHLAIDEMMKCLEGVEFDVVAAAESRGFVFAAPIAYSLCKPLVLVRKAGKLPFDTISREYSLEYGSSTLEMHSDSIKKGQRVVIVDDLVATGGTLECAAKLVEDLGGTVEKILCLIELKGLKGRELLKDYDLTSVIKYEGK
ncbi:MAG: adenine phosphoribosyltransferase [Lachnospiraceae bacterium]|nr:adenine phosphoribosyltransferase [Lachnospiraceae bacterium]